MGQSKYRLEDSGLVDERAESKNSRRANWSAVWIFTRIEEVPDDGAERGERVEEGEREGNGPR